MVKEGALNIDFSDEIIDAAALTHGGAKRSAGSAMVNSSATGRTKDGK